MLVRLGPETDGKTELSRNRSRLAPRPRHHGLPPRVSLVGERMERGRGVEAARGSATASSVPPSRPAPTHAELARDAVAVLDRDASLLRDAVEHVRAAHAANDSERWTEARAGLDRALGAAARSCERARSRAGEATPELGEHIATAERALDEVASIAGGLTEPPSGIAAVTRETEIAEILSAPIEGTAAAGYEKKERALRGEFDQLSTVESRVLAQRLRRGRPNDGLASQFSRMTAERRERLLAYLDGARRRDAVRDARGPKRLPDSIRGDLESATGGSLDHVRIHADDHGSSVAAAHDARAVAIGAEIYMGDGQLDTSSPDGRELLAHEVAHVVQAQAHPSTMQAATKRDERDERDENAAEVEADQFAAEFRKSGSAMSWKPTVGVNGATPMRKKGPNVLKPPASKPSSSPIVVPDKNHPAVKDGDGEQLIQTDKTTGRGKPAVLPHKNWKALATVAETVTVADDAGDNLSIEITYRLEERPADVGEVPDIWIHTERRALLTLGSGEHAGATIVGQARVRIGPDEALDPKVAISRQSIGPSHSAQVYLEASQEFVNVFGHSGRRSLQADGVDNDVLVYDDPLRTMMGLKRILKKQHVAGQGDAVAQLHHQAPKLLEAAKLATAILEGHIKAIKSHHDGDSPLPQVRWVLGDIANWLAANHLRGRGDSEEARQLRAVHRRLLDRYETAKAVRAPERDHVDDVLGIPFRFVERTGEGLKEVGAMTVDAVALGVEALGKWKGTWNLNWEPISKYGKWVQQSGASSTDGLVTMVNGFADQWSDAIERAGNGDYSGVMDVGLDTVLMIDGARTTGNTAIAKGAQIIAKVRELSKKARAVAGRVPTEVSHIVTAMAEAADAFAAKQQAAGMQTAGGPDLPGGPTAESIVAGLKAAKETYQARRLSQKLDHSIATLKLRLGKTKAPDVAEWITRVQAVFGGDTEALGKFLDGVGIRLIEPAPFMRQVEALLGSTNLGSNDIATALRNIFNKEVLDPTTVLGEIQWLTTRTLSAESRSMLIRRAAKGEADLDWIRRSQLTDTELELMGRDTYTSWKEFELASDIESRRNRIASPKDKSGAVINANTKARGIAGELVGAEAELPDGLKVKRRIASNNKEPSSDFEIVARDGSPAELEVKAHDPSNWPSLLDDYEEWLKNPASFDKEPQVARLLRQVTAGRARGRKVYVAVSDGMSRRSRTRLLEVLTPAGVPDSQLVFLPEAEILRVGKLLREHMGIKQPKPPPKKAQQ